MKRKKNTIIKLQYTNTKTSESNSLISESMLQY